MAKIEASFTDDRGRKWSVAVTPYEYEQIKTTLDLDLYDIVNVRETGFAETLRKLETDDVLLASLLWIIVEDEANEQSVSRKEFVKALSGDSLDAGYAAVMEALQGFFRHSGHRDIVKKLADVLKETNLQAAEMVAEELKAMDAKSMAGEFIKRHIDSLESSDSTSKSQVPTDGGTATTN